MELQMLLDEVQKLGISLTAAGDRIQYRPASLMPLGMVEILKSHKVELLQTLQQRTTSRADTPCPVLDEWRRVSIPQWRRILGVSIEQRDRKREEYARWMLKEILFDPEYKED